MGWFDDDDDDDCKEEDEKEIRNKREINDNYNDQDEDPLDAYMKTLGDIKSTNKNPIANTFSETRLDVDNEDEATSHWVGNNNNNITEPPLNEGSDNKGGMAFRSMQCTFDKSPDQESGGSTTMIEDRREVDIRLQHVQHDQVGYARFQKVLLPMSDCHGAIERNVQGGTSCSTACRNTSEGHKWRKENQVTCHPPLDPVIELRDILPDQVLTWNATKKITKPTLVQSQTLGVALCGKDAIVTGCTGSGKTRMYLSKPFS